jgi:hypothetical protein
MLQKFRKNAAKFAKNHSKNALKIKTSPYFSALKRPRERSAKKRVFRFSARFRSFSRSKNKNNPASQKTAHFHFFSLKKRAEKRLRSENAVKNGKK